jgi:hypothetical protein
VELEAIAYSAQLLLMAVAVAVQVMPLVLDRQQVAVAEEEEHIQQPDMELARKDLMELTLQTDMILEAEEERVQLEL